MHNIDVTLRVGIANGPEIIEKSTEVVDAYGEIVFEIRGGETKKVEVQPSSKEDIVFLLIKSSKYTVKNQTGTSVVVISYYVEDPTPTTTPTTTPQAIKLDKPHLYNGPGGVAILKNDPRDFWFTNNLPLGATEKEKKENTAEIQILVGRKAVKLDK